MRWWIAVWFSLAGCAVPLSAEDLAESLAKFGQDLGQERVPEARRLETDVARRLREANQRSTAAWRSIQTLEEWQAFRAATLQKLRSSLGAMPLVVQPPRVVVTSSQTGDGFKIDNLLVESAPRLWITANLYRPTESPASAPGLVICHSHHTPKTHGELQDMGMTWARMGAYVLIPDLTGYGERREHGFETAADYPGEYRVGRQDYYFRHDLAIQAQLAGASLMGYYVRDLSRCADVLLAQPGIDSGRLALLGSVAGGGDPVGVTGALDERFQVVVPFNFGGPQPETRFPLPDDAEDSFQYAGSGSWESTRNLARSAADGFLPWAIVGSIAPRKLIYAHEFAWDRERDPVWRRLERVYQWHGVTDGLDFTHGRGSVRGQAPESTHCTHIGAEHRRRIHAALARWFNWPDGASLEYSRRVPAESLRCWTDEAKRELSPRPLRELLYEQFDKNLESRRSQAAALPPAERSAWRRAEWERRVGSLEPPPVMRQPQDLTESFSRDTRAGFVRSNFKLAKSGEAAELECDDWLLPSDRELCVSLLLIAAAGERPAPAIVVIAPQGRGKWLAERSERAAAALRSGKTLAIVELRGMGRGRVGDGRDRTSASTAVAASELMLGESRIAAQVRELRGVIELLRGSRRIQGEAIEVWADSGTAARDPAASLKTPHGVDRRPPMLDPAPAFLARLACSLDDRLRLTRVTGEDVDAYQTALERPWVYVPLDTVPLNW